ncbi:MAG: inositol monophosphatase family protein [Pseudomonadota bacterium]
MTNEYLEFIENTLMPAANDVIRQYYDAYKKGDDIDVQTKADQSPASAADREAEKALRALINKTYPDHGIWGEEFVGENLEAEFVWILDPLDGTKQFLSKQDHCFVILIGLFQNKKPLAGGASDPLSEKVWLGSTSVLESSNNKVASTAPDEMFRDHKYKSGLNELIKDADITTSLNAKSFLSVLDGDVSVGIESRLSLHDIAALIPIIDRAGAIATDFEGNLYSQKEFEFNNDKYDLLVTAHQKKTNEVLNIIQQ